MSSVWALILGCLNLYDLPNTESTTSFCTQIDSTDGYKQLI